MIPRSRGEKVFNVFNIFILSIICVITLYPFINIAAIAFNNGIDTMRGGITVYPRMPTLENFRVALNYSTIKSSILVSIGRAVLGTIYHVFAVSTAAYALTKRNLPFMKAILIYLFIPMFLQAGLIPGYINISNLGLVNNYLVYILPVGFSFYHCIIIRTYMKTISPSLEESALMDGASYFNIFFRIIIPLTLPAIAAISIFQAVFLWNDFWTTLLFVSNKKLHTLQFTLRQVLRGNTTQEIMSYGDFIQRQEDQRQVTTKSLQMAILLVTITPIICVYPFLQKYFVKGVMIGAVKE